MKLKKIMPIVLVITILTLAVTPTVLAMPGKNKGEMPPGLLKNMILKSDLSEEEAVELIIENEDSLSPGILKEIIIALDISEDSLEELEDEGILDGLPGGILKEIHWSCDDDNEQEIEVEGTLTDIDLRNKVIEIDGIEYELPKEVEVEIDGEKADLRDLKVGMEVELEIENEQAELEAESAEELVIIEGVIEDLDLTGVYHITVDEKEYKIAEKVEVTLDGEEAVLADLEVGMEAEIEIINEKAARIDAQSIECEEIEGNISDLDLIGIYHITIDETEYELSRDAQVIVNGYVSSLEDLETGMNAVIELRDEIVVKVKVEFEIEEIEGYITAIDLQDSYIVIDEVEYKLAEEVEISLNNEETVLEDLEIEMEIIAVQVNGELVEISAFNEEIFEVRGKISAIDLNDRHIEIGGVNYQLATETIVKVDGETAALTDLIVGMFVEAELIDEKIVEIHAEIIETSQVEGVITDLDLIGIYHVAIDDQEYNLLNNAIVTLNEAEAQLTDLQLGMSAIVYLVDNDVIKIEATMVNTEIVLGEIKDIDLIGVYHIIIRDKEYELSYEAQVTIDGIEAALEDLETGLEAIVLVEDDIAVNIDAKTSEFITVQGLLTDINIDEEIIAVNETIYSFSDDVEVFIDQVKVLLTDLEIEMVLEIEIDNGLVKVINANSMEQVIEVQGTLTGLNISKRTITVDKEQYDLADDMELVTVNGVNASLQDIAVHMNVELELQNNIVTKIAAQDSVEQIAGEIIEILLTTAATKLTIAMENSETAQYQVSKGLLSSSSGVLNLGNYVLVTILNSIIVEAMIIN